MVGVFSGHYASYLVDGPHLYLVSYKPLVLTKTGREASTRYSLPPFIDGSIRREPDLEHSSPSITCICRVAHFAPRLRVGDIVVYYATKWKYGAGEAHRRVTAILRVARLFDSHAAAAAWYHDRALPLPNNCLVRDNPPYPVAQSHRHVKGAAAMDDVTLARLWERKYQERAGDHGRFVVCERLWQDLSWEAPRLHDEHLLDVFGRMPITRIPKALPLDRLPALCARLVIRVPPSDR